MQVFDLTRRKEELKLNTKANSRIYVCGPTVYDFFHLGNARPFVVTDTCAATSNTAVMMSSTCKTLRTSTIK